MARKFSAVALSALAFLAFTGFQMSGPQSTIVTAGPVAEFQRHLFYITLAVCVFIFITVGGVLAYAQWKFRARATDDDSDPPPQTHGHPIIEVGLIIASILLLVIIAVPTVKGIWYTADAPNKDEALVVKVTGYQWWFKFEYPELGVVTGNEMAIPTNRPIHIDLRTVDVIHSFWVPKLAGKVDLMPNRANHLWLQADHADYFWAQCAEYCGESHANMKFRVIALDDLEFQAWVERQKAEARTVGAPAAAAAAALNTPPAIAEAIPQARVQFVSDASDTRVSIPDAGSATGGSPFAWWQAKQALPEPGAENVELIARGRQLFAQKACMGCHTIRGHNAFGITGPDLTHFGSRTTIAAAMMDNTAENLRLWLAHPGLVKPGNLMWRDGYVAQNIQLTDQDLDALVAYLSSLK